MMINYISCTLFWISYIKVSSTLQISKNVHYLGPLASINKNIEKKWLFINEIDPNVPNIIKKELLSQLKGFKLDDSTLNGCSNQLDKIAHKISNRILKKKNKFRLNNLFILEDIAGVSEILDLFLSLFENPVVYSIWNLKSSIIPSKSQLVLEIQYRFPIKLKGVPTFYFSPIVTYKANFDSRQNAELVFDNEKILLDTDPLIPWKTYEVGSFSVYPPCTRFSFNVP